jgi:hypothetical protein
VGYRPDRTALDPTCDPDMDEFTVQPDTGGRGCNGPSETAD